MEVANPRRILAVSLESDVDTLSRLIQDLSGTAPEASDAGDKSSLAGTSHNLTLRTSYYKATVPVWLDLVTVPEEWAAAFLTDEAAEVRDALGALIVVFTLSQGRRDLDRVRDLIQHVGSLLSDGLGGWEWDGVRLAVGVGDGSETDEWDEMCAEAGLEFVRERRGHVVTTAVARNELGELTGLARVKEALEANDWAQTDSGATTAAPRDVNDDTHVLEEHHSDEILDATDLAELRQAFSRTEETAERAPEDVDGELSRMEGLMSRLLTAREAGREVGEAQRRRLAARAVAEVMREL